MPRRLQEELVRVPTRNPAFNHLAALAAREARRQIVRSVRNYATEYVHKPTKAPTRKMPKSKPKDEKVHGKWTNPTISASRRVRPAKRKKRRHKSVSTKKRIARLEKSVLDEVSTYKNRVQNYGKIVSTDGKVGYFSHAVCNHSQLKTNLVSLPVTNDAGSIVLVSHDAKSKSFRQRCQSKLMLRNNYQHPCKVRVYLLEPKAELNVLPDNSPNGPLLNTADQDWVAQTTVSAQNLQDPLLFPTDNKEFMHKWKILQTQKFDMNTGDEVTLHNDTGYFKVPFNHFEEFTEEYQARLRTRVWLIRIHGPMCHSALDDDIIGFSNAKLDFIIRDIYTIRYDSGPGKTYFDKIFASNPAIAEGDQILMGDKIDADRNNTTTGGS